MSKDESFTCQIISHVFFHLMFEKEKLYNHAHRKALFLLYSYYHFLPNLISLYSTHCKLKIQAAKELIIYGGLVLEQTEKLNILLMQCAKH